KINNIYPLNTVSRREHSPPGYTNDYFAVFYPLTWKDNQEEFAYSTESLGTQPSPIPMGIRNGVTCLPPMTAAPLPTIPWVTPCLTACGSTPGSMAGSWQPSPRTAPPGPTPITRTV